MIVEFKSEPQYFEKEKDGRKPNTVRVIDNGDPRFQALAEGRATHVRIRCGEDFIEREITDYSVFLRVGIISWRHEVQNA